MPIQQSTITLTPTAMVHIVTHTQNKDMEWQQQSPYRHNGRHKHFFLGQMIWDRHVYIVNNVSFTIYVWVFACGLINLDLLACVHPIVCGLPTWQKREEQFTIKLISINVKSGHCTVWIWDRGTYHTSCAV